MRNYLWFAVWALSLGVAFGQPVGALDPVRPGPRDLAVRPKPPRNQNLAWFPLSGAPHTASQYEKDALEWSLVFYTQQAVIAVSPTVAPDGTVLDAGIPACKSALSFCYGSSGLSAITARLGVDYEARALCKSTCGDPTGGGIWDVPIDGRHYSITRFCLERLRGCLSSGSGAKACATKLGTNRSLLDLLDLDVAGGRCVKGAPFPAPALPARLDTARDDVAPVDSRPALREELRPRTPEQLAALHATHEAHQQAIVECLGGPPATPGAVPRAHLAYEQTMNASERQLHFALMKPFSGRCNARWTADECCRWKQLTHVFHMRWARAQEAGDWGASREADTDHFNAHTCLADGSDKQRVLFSCGNGRRVSRCYGGKKTCREALAVLTAQHLTADGAHH